MTEREEIINSLNACMDVHRSGIWSSGCAFCSYAKQSNPKCFMDLTKDVIELLKHDAQTIESMECTIDKLTKALAEQPEQKHGHWISYGCGLYRCSVCNDGKNMNFVPNYCSTCGARMDEKMDGREVKQNG